jgi:hypothetical protein
MKLLRLALLFLPVALSGLLRAPATAGPPMPISLGPTVFISSPRQSIPTPEHNEATCAFCQAVAFTPYAPRASGALPEPVAAEHREMLSSESRLTHAASSRPPSSRAPPTVRDD